VRTYAEHAMHKLAAHNRVHAVAIALRLGLIS
jgi:DNA-binding CsgD family transcriptional regulator